MRMYMHAAADWSKMVERLACALKEALQQKTDMQAVVSAIENIAPTSRERNDFDTSEC